MNAKEIKKYWDDRAVNDATSQATTNDVYMRTIEQREITTTIRRFRQCEGMKVLDVGCGDGETTRSVATACMPLACGPAWFDGMDYSGEMIKIAKKNDPDGKVTFLVRDITKRAAGTSEYDVVYTTRCIINIPTWTVQRRALSNIRRMLGEGGIYIMVENFQSGQCNMNRMRARYDLPSIPIRKHNLYLRENDVFEFMRGIFKLESMVNISSSYYIATRVLYAAACKKRKRAPDYFSVEHKLASQLPYFGNCGPIYCLVWRAI